MGDFFDGEFLSHPRHGLLSKECSFPAAPVRYDARAWHSGFLMTNCRFSWDPQSGNAVALLY